MDFFNYHNGKLHVEGVDVCSIADKFDTPTYVYSRSALESNFNSYGECLGNWPNLICYAVKANSNLAVLNILARQGAGFDIVSVGELERVLAAGGNASKVVFSGVGKKTMEIERALEVGIHCFNVESEAELDRIQILANKMNTIAPISLRVNPDVDAKTHPYISTGLKDNKFGVDISHAVALYQKASAMSNIKIIGIAFHIGSQLISTRPLMDALDRVICLIDNLEDKGINIRQLDIGGGLGVSYNQETPPSPGEYINDVIQKIRGRNLKLLVEPGRSIAAQAGILLTKVELIKITDQKAFAIVDAAMNDQVRPSMYGAYHDIVPVNEPAKDYGSEMVYDIVGPICETGDFLGKGRSMCIKENDFLAVKSAGAYGFSMSSNYNSRNRPAEVIVDNGQVHLVRRRETFTEQIAPESLLPQ